MYQYSLICVSISISLIRCLFLVSLIRSLHLIRDTSKEKPLELEMGWLCAETGFKHAHVPKDLVLASDAAGKVALEGGATLAYTQQTGSAATEEKTMEVE